MIAEIEGGVPAGFCATLTAGFAVAVGAVFAGLATEAVGLVPGVTGFAVEETGLVVGVPLGDAGLAEGVGVGRC